jgi:hypothetical protein
MLTPAILLLAWVSNRMVGRSLARAAPELLIRMISE